LLVLIRRCAGKNYFLCACVCIYAVNTVNPQPALAGRSYQVNIVDCFRNLQLKKH